LLSGLSRPRSLFTSNEAWNSGVWELSVRFSWSHSFMAAHSIVRLVERVFHGVVVIHLRVLYLAMSLLVPGKMVRVDHRQHF